MNFKMNKKADQFHLVLVTLLIYLTFGCTKPENNSAESKLTDNMGNIYNTVTIGNQVWMGENLKTTKFNDGTSIHLLTDDERMGFVTSPILVNGVLVDPYPHYNGPYYYNFKSVIESGVTYNYIAINSGKLCPTGWHVPSNQEWQTMIDYLGGATVAGGKLKETGTVHWSSPNTGATNESGFTAIPTIFWNSPGQEYVNTTSFWTSDGISWSLDYNTARTSSFNSSSSWGSYSVRCIKLK